MRRPHRRCRGRRGRIGLAGVATVGQNRLFATDDVVAVVAQESEFGAGAGCDFDGDTNFDDFVLRWVPVADLGAAGMPTTLMLPIDRNLPGGAMGALEYADRFVVASPRTFTIETVPVTGSFVHWLDPLTDNAWTSDLFDPDAGVSDPGVKVVVDQLSDETRTGRVPMGLREASVR